MELDEKDLRIIDQIIRQPGATVAQFAKALEIPEDTLSKRISALVAAKHIAREVRVVNWKESGYPFLYQIDITIDQRELAIGQGGPRTKPNDKSSRPAYENISSQEELALYVKDRLGRDPRFSNNLVVQSVKILMGHQADLSVTVRAKNPEVVTQFVVNGLRTLGGVLTTMTSHAAWWC